MKRLFNIVLGFLLITSNVYATDGSILSQIKGDARKVCNGRYWNSLSSESKTAYLIAFGEGEFSYSAILDTDNVAHNLKIAKEELERIDKWILNKLGSEKNVGEISDYLDKFYSNSLNINIPIHFAITIISLQQHGGKSDEMIQLLRANSVSTID